MKVLNITSLPTMSNDNQFEVFQYMLRNNIRSEAIYNQHFISIEILIEDNKELIDVYYRLFWEANYLNLREHSKLTKTVDDFKFEMNITIGEALDILYDATPPLLREQLPNSTKELEDIVLLLKTFLMEDDPQQITYIGIMRQHTKFQIFEKGTSFTTDKISLIRRSVPSGVICHVMQSDISIKSLMDNSFMEGLVLFHCNNSSELFELSDVLRKFKFTVLDVTKSMSGTYVLVNGTMYFGEIVQRSYEPFMK